MHKRSRTSPSAPRHGGGNRGGRAWVSGVQSLVFGVQALLLGPTAWADEQLVAAPEALRYCAVCHGVELRGNVLVDAPNLSVLPAWYVEQQLLNYKRGLRAPSGSPDLPGRTMQPMAAILDEAGIQAAVAYVDSVPDHAPAPTLAGDAQRGAGLYATCGVCHGEQGQGNQSFNAPPLAGQNDWYLARQLRNYRSGARGATPGDLRGAQMRASMSLLQSDADIQDVVAYISSLGATPR